MTRNARRSPEEGQEFVGNPLALSASGTYRGRYQIDPSLRRRVRGAGDPIAAPTAEQTRPGPASGAAAVASVRLAALTSVALLGPGDVRALARRLGVRPTKALGQNFVIDPNTVRRIVRCARVAPDDVVVEVGPGLGSLTVGLLPAAARVVAVEVDPVLARALPGTVARHAPAYADRLIVLGADALAVEALPGPPPTALVANLPYNVAVPVLLSLLERFPSMSRGLVMVQAEVAERLTASPGSRTYGAPSVKLAWYAGARRAGAVPRTVFWPQPNVGSALVAIVRREPPPTAASREQVFALVDAAFAQRRKTLRAALGPWAGSVASAEAVLVAAGIDPRTRGEMLRVADFARLAAARAS